MEIILNNLSVGPLKNINMCLFNYKITGIIGKSGSGKSLLAATIATIIKPSSGDYIINKKVINLQGPNVDYNKLRFNIGIVMQNMDEQFFEKTVDKHISYQLKVYNYKNDKNHIINSLKMAGLGAEFLKREIKTLSDTEKFKVLLATALSINPKILILDDPTCFLDEASKAFLTKLLKIMKNRYKKTIIVLGNDLDFILKLVDYVYVLDANKIVIHGDKYEVFQNIKLDKLGIEIPEIIKFSRKFSEKSKTPILKRDNVNDLIKDIYYLIEKKERGKK